MCYASRIILDFPQNRRQPGASQSGPFKGLGTDAGPRATGRCYGRHPSRYRPPKRRSLAGQAKRTSSIQCPISSCLARHTISGLQSCRPCSHTCCAANLAPSAMAIPIDCNQPLADRLRSTRSRTFPISRFVSFVRRASEESPHRDSVGS